MFPLIIPFIAGAATTTTTALAELFAGGVVVGGTAVGGWWWFSKKPKETLSKAQEAALVTQVQITNDRIEKAKLKITSLCETMLHLVLAVDTAKSGSQKNTLALQKVVQKISETTLALTAAITREKESCEKLVIAIPALEQISKKSLQMSEDAVNSLTVLNQLLSEKNRDLVETKVGILQMNTALCQLTSAFGLIQQLKLENASLRDTIIEKDQHIQQLETGTHRMIEQCRFFKQALELTTHQSVSRQLLTNENTGSDEHARANTVTID